MAQESCPVRQSVLSFGFSLAGHDFTTTNACLGFNVGWESNRWERGDVMKKTEIKSLSIDELWVLHEAVGAVLAEKMAAEKKLLEERLRLLTKSNVGPTGKTSKLRRPYPPVLPKFRNPDKPAETWAGRGKQPRWLRKQLRTGKRMDDFRIKSVAA